MSNVVNGFAILRVNNQLRTPVTAVPMTANHSANGMDRHAGGSSPLYEMSAVSPTAVKVEY